MEQLEKTIELDPNFGLAYYYLGFPLIVLGRYDEAVSAFQKSIERTGGMPVAILDLGYAYGRAGRIAEAKKVLQELEALCRERKISSSLLAYVHAGMGDREKVLECLNQAYMERSPLMVWVKVLSDLDIVRSDPRLQELLCRMDLAQ